MDYLFVDRNLAGIRRNNAVDIEDIEKKLSAKHVETIRRLSQGADVGHESVVVNEKGGVS